MDNKSKIYAETSIHNNDTRQNIQRPNNSGNGNNGLKSSSIRET